MQLQFNLGKKFKPCRKIKSIGMCRMGREYFNKQSIRNKIIIRKNISIPMQLDINKDPYAFSKDWIFVSNKYYVEIINLYKITQ